MHLVGCVDSFFEEYVYYRILKISMLAFINAFEMLFLGFYKKTDCLRG